MLVFVLASITVVLGGYEYFFDTTQDATHVVNATSDSSLTTTKSLPSVPHAITPQVVVSEKRAHTPLPELSTEQLTWLNEHGYLPPLDDQELSPDGLVWLQAMAESRDKVAIERYAQHLALTAEPNAQLWLTRSAAAGSTRALLQLARQALVPSNIEQADAITAAAWLTIAQRRGDPFAQTMMTSIESPPPLADIEKRAEALTAQLATTRQLMGFAEPALTNFPGTVPARLEMVLNTIEQQED